MKKTDVCIIGAGLLGCFCARNLSRYDLNVTVLEKEEDVSRGISKANTGIIYTGYDTKPGSQKNKLCVQANSDFDRLCEELEVPFCRPGSLMITYGPVGEEKLRKKYRDGMEGRVRHLELISGAEAEAMEPNLKKGITLALYAEDTGVVDPWELCIAAYENAADNGVDFHFSEEVINIKRDGKAFIVETEKKVYRADALINAAGLCSDRVRELVEAPKIRLFPKAADYLILDKTEGSFVKHVIFHQAEKKKGLTLVPTVDGNLLVGPTVRDLENYDSSQAAYETAAEGFEKLRELCEEVVPELSLDEQIRSFGSLRPNPYEVRFENGNWIKAEKSIHDFSLLEENGLFSLIGIKTPGMTFANELGKLTAERTAAFLGKTKKNENFSPKRKAILRVRDLEPEERAEKIAQDPDYGKVICRCIDVSKAEVKEAIRRGSDSYEAIRRRTGVGMGHCQGGRCRKMILELLEEEKDKKKKMKVF